MYREYAAKYGVPREGDILVTGVGTLGICYVVTDDAPFYYKDGNIIWLKRKNAINSRYVEYAFKSDLLRSQIDDSVGATVGTYTIIKAKSTRIPVPPIAEQERIVAILDEAFEAIDKAKQNAEKNLQNARELFESHLQSVFTQRGDGWIETTIGDQMRLQRGFDITKDQQIFGEIPVVSSGGIKSYHNQAMAAGPGVVIGRKGTLGKVYYVAGDYWPHDTTLWIKEFYGNLPRFVFYFLRNLDVVHLDTGTANPALNRNVLHPIRIGWPPIKNQEAMTKTLDDLEMETQRLESVYRRKLAALDELKKSLLHRAFSGEL